MRKIILTLVLVFLVAGTYSANAAVTGYSDHSSWASSSGITVLETFDGLSTGVVTSLSSVGVTSMSGLNYLGSTVSQYITNQYALPFPMFSAGALPSSPNFISNNMNYPTYATGSITFDFAEGRTAIGAFVADSSPLGNFSIEVFSGVTSLGVITVSPRTLPNSFVGIVSDSPFTSAKFFANYSGDSWGLDNLEVSKASTVPVPAAVLLLGSGLIGLAGIRRKLS